jgi:Helix-turn-helix domain
MSNFSSMLDRLVRASGIEAQELARQVPCNPAHLSRMRQGKKRPSLQVADRLDTILGAGGTLVAAAVTDGLPADRPEILAAIGAVIDPAETAELTRRLRASAVDAATLDALARTTETLCTQYAYRDPMQLRHEAQQWLAYIDKLLGKRAGLREHRELLVTGGWLALLTGCLEYDSGMAAAAEATRVSAYHLGREAGHAEIVAWSLEMAAWFAHTRHDLQGAIAWARAGQEAAPGAGVAVQLIAHEARSLGRMGDKRAVTAALDRGHMLLQGVTVVSNTVNHFVVDPTKFDFYAMDCFRVAGEDERAAEHAHEVLSAGPGPDGKDMSPMRMSEARIALGCVAARRGDLDEAASWGADAFRADRKCLPSLALVAGELDAEISARYPDARPALEFRELLAEIRLALPAIE